MLFCPKTAHLESAPPHLENDGKGAVWRGRIVHALNEFIFYGKKACSRTARLAAGLWYNTRISFAFIMAFWVKSPLLNTQNCLPGGITFTTQGNTPGQCHAIVNYALPTYSDNCAGGSATLLSGLPSGSSFPEGATVNVWRAADNNGNSATCSFTITVSCGTSPSPSEGGDDATTEQDAEDGVSSPPTGKAGRGHFCLGSQPCCDGGDDFFRKRTGYGRRADSARRSRSPDMAAAHSGGSAAVTLGFV